MNKDIFKIISRLYEDGIISGDVTIPGIDITGKTLIQQYDEIEWISKDIIQKPEFEIIQNKYIDMLRDEKWELVGKVRNEIINEQIDTAPIEQYIYDPMKTETDINLIDETLIRTELTK